MDAVAAIEVADRINARTERSVEIETVRAGAAQQSVRTGAAIEEVVAAAAEQGVAAGIAGQRVVTPAAGQDVGQSIARQGVVECGAREILDVDQHVASGAAGDLRARECQAHLHRARGVGVSCGIAAIAAVQHVIARAAVESVVARPAADRISG